jgi:predicted O-methyltransferase YrrM
MVTKITNKARRLNSLKVWSGDYEIRWERLRIHLIQFLKLVRLYKTAIYIYTHLGRRCLNLKGWFQERNNPFLTFVPPGHYYSPIPCLDDIKAREAELFGNVSKEISGINLNEERQIDLFRRLSEYYKEQPFEPRKKANLRYFFENASFGYADAIILYCMLRFAQPKRVVEIGSGYSSCVILDTNEFFFGNSIQCTLIEPYPRLLLTLIKDSDRERTEILQKKVQDVDLNRFRELSSGDILFVDSSHMSKIASDVNHIFFKILPALRSGVYIHFHDILHGFGYPQAWAYKGIAWNEAYLLRAFLQYNGAFEIQFFNSFFAQFHSDELADKMPLCMRAPGVSIWLRKVE